MEFDNRLTWGDYVYVCYLMRLCADAALKEANRDGEKRLSEDYIKKQLELLQQVYSESSYAQNEDSYGEYVENQIRECLHSSNLEYCDGDIARILLPVAFFSLIIQNESNPNTVTRRVNKVKAGSDQSWGNRNPYMQWKAPYRPTPESADLNDRIQKATKLALDAKIYSSIILSSDIKDIAHQVDSLKDNSQYLLFASSLAKSGIFLEEMLSVTSNTESQLDTILRLYCVDSLQYTIKACRLLVDDQYAMVSNRRYAVMIDGNIEFRPHYNMDICIEYARYILGAGMLHETDFESEKKYLFPISFRNEDSASALKKFSQNGISNKWYFSSLYEFLQKNFIYSFGGGKYFKSLLNYSLDADMLTQYVDLEKKLDGFLRIERKLAKCLLELREDVTDNQSLLSGLRALNKCQHLLAKQPYISKNKTEKEDIDNVLEQTFATLKNVKLLYQKAFPNDTDPIGLDKYNEDDYDYFSDDDDDYIWGEESLN